MDAITAANVALAVLNVVFFAAIMIFTRPRVGRGRRRTSAPGPGGTPPPSPTPSPPPSPTPRSQPARTPRACPRQRPNICF